jgi:hypothetical protein
MSRATTLDCTSRLIYLKHKHDVFGYYRRTMHCPVLCRKRVQHHRRMQSTCLISSVCVCSQKSQCTYVKNFVLCTSWRPSMSLARSTLFVVTYLHKNTSAMYAGPNTPSVVLYAGPNTLSVVLYAGPNTPSVVLYAGPNTPSVVLLRMVASKQHTGVYVQSVLFGTGQNNTKFLVTASFKESVVECGERWV